MSRRIKKKNKPENKSENIDINTNNSLNIDTTLYDHLRPENVRKMRAEANEGTWKLIPLAIIGFLIIALIIGGGPSLKPPQNGENDGTTGGTSINTNNNGPFIPVKDLWLNSHSDVTTHFHLFLSIAIFNSPVEIPGNLGVYSSSMKFVHTHDTSGKLHIETPSDFSGSITLYDFISIWSEWAGLNYEMSSSTLLDKSGVVEITSNGEMVIMNNPQDYALIDRGSSDEIIVLSLS